VVLANAEQLPLLPASFDIVLSDNGAMSWADPYQTVPEVARVLRPGGQLAFCTNSPFFALCWNSGRRELRPELRRGYFTLRTRVVSAGAVDYVLPYGEWIRLFTENGLTTESLIEEPPDADAVTTFTDRPAEWTRNWPLEMIWRVRKGPDAHGGTSSAPSVRYQRSRR
jgi:SAM-dependent methyltransferase